jgi:hypothetical protein
MRLLPRALLAGGLGFTVSLVVAACGGGSGLLSGDQANTINSQLNQISSALAAGDCRAVSSATVNLSNAVANLPSGVNPTLRSNLDQGVSTVGQLANQQCKPASTGTPTTSTSTSTTTTTTTPTATSHTTTSSATTTTTPTATSTSETTPSGPGTTSTGSGGAGIGGGAGGGNGNGNGNGTTGGTSAGNGNGG